MFNQIYHGLSSFQLPDNPDNNDNNINNDNNNSNNNNSNNNNSNNFNNVKMMSSSSNDDNDANMSSGNDSGNSSKDGQIASLQEQVAALQSALEEQQQRLLMEEAINYQSTNNKKKYKKHHHHKTKSKHHNQNSYHNQQHRSSKSRGNMLSPYSAIVKDVVMNNKSGKTTLATSRLRMGRSASICTQQALDAIPDDAFGGGSSGLGYSTPGYMQRVLNMFQNPTTHMDYLSSTLFGKDVYKLASKVRTVLEKEPRVIFVQSPVYVFGDIHGNIEDLHFFSDNIWRLGMSLTAGNFLFLGDYVDRGLFGLECLAYLFTMKLQLPNKVFLLRGNHETRDVNGWEEHYADRSFLYQCRSRFGDDIGYRIWEICNQAFDRLPLAAVIDQDIFCVHGGIPRPISLGIGGISLGLNHNIGNSSSTTNNNGSTLHPVNLVTPTSSSAAAANNNNNQLTLASRIKDILCVPKVAGINPPYEHEDEIYQQVASDCIWSDPASEEQEITTVDPDTGFGESLRGGGAICFGSKAVTNFMEQEKLSFIMRAHEAHAEGVAVCKGARVFTVFSTSKDHNQGDKAMAGCMLVDNDKLQVINRAPAYKNQYVHRRDSISVAMLSENELQKRMQLGLVTDIYGDSEEEYDDSDDDSLDDEEWENFDETGAADLERQDDSEIDTSPLDAGIENQLLSVAHAIGTGVVGGGSGNTSPTAGDGSVLERSSHHSTGHRGKNGEEYILSQGRRSSVDINSLSDFSYASESSTRTYDWDNEQLNHAALDDTTGDHTGSPSFGGNETNKRPRPIHQLSVASIVEGVEESEEEDEDEEIETVDGGEQQQQTQQMQTL